MQLKKERHPSYATLGFFRTSGGSRTLFGSSIQHSDTITMRVQEASIDRSLNTDWIMGDRQLIEVEMSYSQFAEAITSMNQGSGVPVTLKFAQGKGKIEDCPFINKRQQFEDEFADNLTKTNESVNALIEDVATLFNKKTINKGDRADILSKLNSIYRDINGNSEFVYDCFNRQMDKTVTESKGEIEAFFQNKMTAIANNALIEQKDELLKLNNPINVKALDTK